MYIVRCLASFTDRVATIANVIGTLVVLALVIVVNYDVVARGVFNLPFMGAVEVVQFSMVLIVFLQLPDVIRVNRLTRSDGFLTITERRFPHFARRLQQAIDMVAASFMLIIAIAIWPEFTDAWETQDYFGVPGVFTAPWWPIKLVIFLSATLCSVMFFCKVLLAKTPSKQLDPEPSA